MFIWVTIRIESHPGYKPEKKRELMDELWERLAESKCLGESTAFEHCRSGRVVLMCFQVAPGWVFATTPEIAQEHCEHLRLCFCEQASVR